MIHILNQHDPASALLHKSFTCRCKFQIRESEVSSFTFCQPCYKSRQKAEIETENE